MNIPDLSVVSSDNDAIAQILPNKQPEAITSEKKKRHSNVSRSNPPRKRKKRVGDNPSINPNGTNDDTNNTKKLIEEIDYYKFCDGDPIVNRYIRQRDQIYKRIGIVRKNKRLLREHVIMFVFSVMNLIQLKKTHFLLLAILNWKRLNANHPTFMPICV